MKTPENYSGLPLALWLLLWLTIFSCCSCSKETLRPHTSPLNGIGWKETPKESKVSKYEVKKFNHKKLVRK